MTTTAIRPRRWRGSLLSLAAIYFAFLGGTFITDLDYWPRVVHHILVTLILAAWVISLWARRKTIPATPLDLPVTALIGAWIVTTLFAADPRVSIEALWQIGFHGLLFYILVDLMRSWGASTVLRPIFFAAAVVVFVGLFEFVSWYLGLGWLPMFHQGWPQIGGLAQPIPPVMYRLAFTLNVPTFLAGYLSVLMPVALAWAISTPSSTVRQGLFLWLGGASLVLALTFSRGGLLSLGVALAVFAFLIAVGSAAWRERLAALVRNWKVRVVLVMIIGIMAVAVIIGLVAGDPFGHAAGDRIRVNLLQSAWQIGLSHPLTGVGPYGFGRAMRQYRDPLVTGDYFTSAHSIPLQVFAESGLLGVGALAWLLVAGGRVAWQRWKSADGAERIRLAGIVAALMGFAAQNLADTLINTTVMLPWLALGAYLVAPTETVLQPRNIALRRTVQVAVSLAIVLSMGGWAISDTAQYHFNRAVQMSKRGDLRTALDEITMAAAIDPAMGYYRVQQAQFLGELAATDPAFLAPAVDAYESALRVDGSYALIRANRALLLDQSGDLASAQAEMQAAISLQPDDPYYRLGAGRLAEQAGRMDDAVQAYQAALTLRPDWIGSPYWDASQMRGQARISYIKSVATRWPVQEMAVLDPRCWSSSSEVYPAAQVDPLCEAEIYLRLNNDPQAALPWADQAVAAAKADPLAYLLRADAHRLMGDAGLAERDARTALFLGDTHAYFILGKLAEDRGDDGEAARDYGSAPPIVLKSQGWDVAVYQRRGNLMLLPSLDAPGPTRYDFAAWLALVKLDERLGKVDDARVLRDVILRLDPYFRF